VRGSDIIRGAMRGRIGLGLVVMLAATLVLAVPASAHAAQITVSTTVDRVDGDTSSLSALFLSPGSDGKVSLREAVLALKGEVAPADIVLTPGTYVLEGPTTTVSVGLLPEVKGGSLNVVSSVHIDGAGSTVTPRVPAAAKARIFDIDPAFVGGVSFELTGATLAQGWAEGAIGGGAIRAGGGPDAAPRTTVILDGCTIATNKCTPGAAVASSGGALNIGANTDLTLRSCTVFANTAQGVGGSVFLSDNGSGSLTVDRCTFEANRSDGAAAAAGQGGAIYARVGSGGGTISASTFTGNVASSDGTHGPDRGGALFIGGAVSIRDSRIVGNMADDAPGAFGFLGAPDARYNWWGTNSDPTTSTPAVVAGGIVVAPWLQLTVGAAPATVDKGQASSVTAQIVNGAHKPPDSAEAVLFAGPMGTFAPVNRVLSSGVAASTYTAGRVPGPATVSATFDGVAVSTVIAIQGAPELTAARETTFTVGVAGSQGVSAKGYPVPRIAVAGTLPSGLAFAFTGSTGTTSSAAALSGTPASGSGGRYDLSVVATNGVAPDATAPMTVTVVEAPRFRTANATTVTVGVAASFEVTTSGYPVAAITAIDPLPTGLTLTDRGDGTALVAGTPGGAGGIFAIRLRANNGVSTPVDQSLTINVRHEPAIVGARDLTFTVGVSGREPFSTEGYPCPAVSLTGALPSGLAFTASAPLSATVSTATIAGTPAASTGGRYPVTLHSANGVGVDASAGITITVNEAPAFRSADATTFTVGVSGSFEITTTGYPTAAISALDALPNGLALTDNGDGTASISGTPAKKTGGVYPVRLSADNVVGAAGGQTLTITVVQPTPEWAIRQYTWDLQADFERNASTTGETTTIGGISTTEKPGSLVLPSDSLVGTIGGGGPAVGLRATAEPGGFAGWRNLRAKTSVLTARQAVKFAVRVSGDGITWSPPLGRDGLDIDWTTGSGNYFGQAADDAPVGPDAGPAPVYTDLAAIASSRYIDVVVRLEAIDTVSPEVEGVTVSTYREDATAPTVLCDAPTGWRTSDVLVTVGATDTISGVASLAVAVAGSGSPVTNVSTETATVAVSDEGTTTIAYSAIDEAGNRSATATATVQIDRTAPALAILASPSSVSLDVSDAFSGLASVWYLVDGGAPQLYAGVPFSPGLSGRHTVTAWATDVAGNMAVRTREVTVDTAAPTASDDAPAGWRTTDFTVTINAYDALSGIDAIDLAIDGPGGASTASVASDTAKVPVTAEGVTAIDYTALDGAGNRSGVKTATVRIDRTAPDLAIVASPSALSSASISISLVAADSRSGIAGTWYAVDGDPRQAYGLPFDVGTVGRHTISAWTQDGAGNTTMTTRQVSIDSAAPTVTDDAPAGWSTGDVTVTLRATDAEGVASIDYLLTAADGGTASTSVAADTAKVPVTVEGTTTIGYSAIDVAGNRSGSRTATVRIDRTLPSTTATYNAGVSSVPVTMTLSAVDAVSGVGSIWYRAGAGGNKTLYEGPFLVSTPGTTTVTYWAEDVAGNAERPQTATVRVKPAAPAAAGSVTRFYNRRLGVHFYTASEAEKDNVLRTLGSIYRYEGVAYRVNPDNPANSAPLYRFYNVRTGVHFYTVSEAEKEAVQRDLATIYRYEGVAYLVSTSPSGAQPVYRFFDRRVGVHFYTASDDERDTVVRTLGSIYTYEGVAFYIGQ
jgi:hypothetical protein